MTYTYLYGWFRRTVRWLGNSKWLESGFPFDREYIGKIRKPLAPWIPHNHWIVNLLLVVNNGSPCFVKAYERILMVLDSYQLMVFDYSNHYW